MKITELRLQQDLCVTFGNKYPQYRRLLYHILNNARNAIHATQMVGAGLVAGNPDLCLPIPRWPYGALYIELKLPDERPLVERLRSRLDAGTLPDKMGAHYMHIVAQLKQHDLLTQMGNKVVVCYSVADAMKEIESYLGI